MVHLSRIYTRTGDAGDTALADGSRVGKTDLRLAAYADVDEANSLLGVVLAHAGLPSAVETVLLRVQQELFDVGADLSTPVVAHAAVKPLRIGQEAVNRLEAECDRFNAGLPALRSFILPGGGVAAAHLHVARAVIRRAERSTWAALEVHSATMNPLAARYLNRLSDLVFILARVVAGPDRERLWQPGQSRASITT